MIPRFQKIRKAKLPINGADNHNNCSFCDTSMTFCTVIAKGIPKRCGYGAIMDIQYGAHGINFLIKDGYLMIYRIYIEYIE